MHWISISGRKKYTLLEWNICVRHDVKLCVPEKCRYNIFHIFQHILWAIYVFSRWNTIYAEWNFTFNPCITLVRDNSRHGYSGVLVSRRSFSMSTVEVLPVLSLHSSTCQLSRECLSLLDRFRWISGHRESASLHGQSLSTATACRPT